MNTRILKDICFRVVGAGGAYRGAAERERAPWRGERQVPQADRESADRDPEPELPE